MLGLTLSKITGDEPVYASPAKGASLQLPGSYSYSSYIREVKDQGATNKCVPLAISQVVEWYWRSCGMSKADMDVDAVFSARESDDGMSFKQAFDFMKLIGYRLNGVNEVIKGYYMIPSRLLMQEHLVSSAPFVIGLPVYDSQATSFWRGPSLEGFHAVAAVGYTPEGIEFVNSWGLSYGDSGFGVLPWDDVSLIKEAWGMLL